MYNLRWNDNTEKLKNRFGLNSKTEEIIQLKLETVTLK